MKNVLRMGAVLVALVAVVIFYTQQDAGAPALTEVGLQVRQETDEFDPKVVIPRAFPAIEQPETKSAEEVAQSIHDEELVLGVEIDGKARAYPINMLTGPTREIVNDVLAGRSIAATW